MRCSEVGGGEKAGQEIGARIEERCAMGLRTGRVVRKREDDSD